MKTNRSLFYFALAILVAVGALFEGGLLAGTNCCFGQLPTSCGGVPNDIRYYGTGYTNGTCFSTVRDDYGSSCAIHWVTPTCY